MFNKLENNCIKSLNASALILFKEEEKNLRQNKKINVDENNNSKNKINQGNKSVIEKISIDLEDIMHRKNIKHRNDKYISLLFGKNK